MNMIRLMLVNAVSVLALYLATAMPLQACGLAFLPGSAATSVTIDGTIGSTEWAGSAVVEAASHPCLEQNLDGSSLASLTGRDITVYTQRSGSNLYIAIDVSDASLPQTVSGTSPGEKIVILFDPDNNRGPGPQASDFRFELTIPRDNSNLPAHRVWAQGNGSGFNTIAIPSAIEAMSRNRSSGPLGYHVEIKIPFSAIGYSLSNGDFGMALAIVNDLGFQQNIGGFNQWQLTASALPTDPVHLPVNTDDDPLDLADAGSGWNTPDHWGEAFTAGAGDLIYFSHDPAFWKSKDIISAFCNATSFDQVYNALGAGTNPRSSANPFWYKYNASNTCNPVRLWSKLRRRGALVGAEERRVLFLWGEVGISVREWFYMGITDPIELSTSASSPALDDIGALFEITDSIDYAHVSSGLSGHPCLRAIALPKQLSAADEAAFAAFEANPAMRHQVDLGALLSRYDITGQNNQAQMNIMVVDSVTCPSEGACEVPDDRASLGRITVASSDLSGLQLAQANTGGRVFMEVPAASPSTKKMPDAIFDLAGYGIAGSGGAKKYSYIERLGGLQQIINLRYLRERGQIKIPVDFTNPRDLPRQVFVNITQLTPANLTGAKLSIEQPKRLLKPGEKVVLGSQVTASPVIAGCDGKSICGACFGGSDGVAMGIGLIGVGLVGLRLKRRKRKDSGAS